ncbi:hypothetical protein QBC34DRAFT_402326 [Podospora aff. communis PSN243]|uniref:RING-type E3 ubiquitin transferase n=1 Tax=Podospora aff. communis PSN243 TaxID=3040156 RepID=A0AAV9GQV4_9PEZI|nr:hypothetical protein QBC34DRAFT_402326 [Podospora aff. communis PSN243]
MASFGARDRHLDAASGREVVLCHLCRHEWYRDQRESLACPLCNSEAVEIIEPSNDPREVEDFPFPLFSSRRIRQRRPDPDSDPEEDDIDDHLRRGTVPGTTFGAGRVDREPRERQDGDVILRRFADMLMNDLGGQRAPRAQPDPFFPFGRGQNRDGDPDPLGLFPPSGARSPGAPPAFQRTMFRSGPNSATFTFISSSSNMPDAAGGPPGLPPGFPTLFGQIMNNATPPSEREDRPAGSPGARPMPPGGMVFGTGIHELLASLLNPQAAVHGDAVYTQEALDRIITSLMEANPSSNAAPPATQSAIERLEKKRIDENMLGAEGKAECTICIDELHKGDEVTVLPCTHWFHGECVVLWLKEHNTCPICRASIEGGQSGQSGQPSNSGAQQSSAQQPQRPHVDQQFEFRRAGLFAPRNERFSRTRQENQDRLDAIRTAGGYSSGSATNSPARRNSLSPTSTRDQAAGPTRRVRSPSTSRDRDAAESRYNRGDYLDRRSSQSRDTRDRTGQTGQSSRDSNHGGAFSWIRDHLTRSSNSQSDRDRDRRR